MLFAYGKNHTLNAGGTVTALGDSGIALRFDFGGNLLSDYIERRSGVLRMQIVCPTCKMELGNGRSVMLTALRSAMTAP